MFINFYRSSLTASIAVLAILAGGCGGGAGTADTVKVTGTVTYNGSPIADASVTFTPENGRPATGVTNASGEFVLTTFQEGDGAVPGLHKVAIFPHANEIEPMPGTPEAAQAAAKKPPFPERYSDMDKSDLQVQVEKGCEPFVFDLTD